MYMKYLLIRDIDGRFQDSEENQVTNLGFSDAEILCSSKTFSDS